MAYKKQTRRGYKVFAKQGSRHCEPCGLTLYGAHYEQHIDSNSHKKISRFKSLLAQNCLTLDEIGKRLGFTRERARQLANRQGTTGNARRHVCSISRHEAARRAEIEASPFIQAARKECGARGLTVEPTGKRTATINGVDVRLGLLRKWNGYFQTSSMRNRDAEILMFCGADHWLIIPANKYVVKINVMFAASEPTGNRRGNPQDKHDWRDHIDAWHLLENKESAAA